jgi:hypothetical protein
MDFWYSDYKNYKAAPVLTLTEGDEVILDKGIVATIDTTKMVNSATYISKDDSTIYSTHTDEHSVDRYGPHGTRVFFDSDNRGRLLQLALTEVELNKEPTITYTIEMSNGEWLALGDLVRVVVPQLKRDDILPVARLDVNVGGRVTTSVTLGEARLSMGEVIKRLS